MILSLINLTIGFVIGLYLYAQVVLPILYSFPVSVYLFFKGKLKFRGILVCFIAPIVWTVAMFILGIILAKLAPAVIDYIATNSAFNLGQLLGIGVLLLNFLSKKGREDMWNDYINSMWRYLRV